MNLNRLLKNKKLLEFFGGNLQQLTNSIIHLCNPNQPISSYKFY